MVGIDLCDSGVVIGHQVDEFTHTWSAEWFIAHFHIYPQFTGKVWSLSHFPMEPGCEDYSFLDQAVADFKQGLDSIFTDSIETSELDTSLDELNAITSSVSFGFLHLVSTISDTSKPQLASSTRTHKLWCQTRASLALVSLATKMSASKLICYFSNHPTTLDSGLLHHQMTSHWLLPTGRLSRVYQNVRLALVLLLMLLSTQSSSFLIPELPLLILIPLCPILREELYLCPKCMNNLSRFMTFWTLLCPNTLGTQLIF